jgi:hypothetical protein
MSADSDPTLKTETGQHSPQNEANGRGPGNSKRFTFPVWGDSIDRAICVHAGLTLPERSPVSGRPGLATADLVVVERAEGSELICSRLHDGPCAWPWHVGTA